MKCLPFSRPSLCFPWRFSGAAPLLSAFGSSRTAVIKASPAPIFDPKNGSQNGKARIPFAANIIPHSRIDPKIAALVASNEPPNPNVPRTGSLGLARNYLSAGVDALESIGEAGPRLLDMHGKDLADPRVKESQVAGGKGSCSAAGVSPTYQDEVQSAA